MVTEEIIEKVISQYEVDEDEFVTSLSGMMDEHPALLAFLSHESNDVLTEDEKDMMWYITLILLTSAQEFGYKIEELSDQALGNHEESNWQVYQEQSKGSFRERVTVFFNDYEEEDLLAFVEDTLEIEDEGPITPVGRDVIFISAKAIIDTLLNYKN